MVDTFSSGDPWDDPRKRQMSPAQFPGLLDSSQMPGFPPVGGPQESSQGGEGIQGGGVAGNAPAGQPGASGGLLNRFGNWLDRTTGLYPKYQANKAAGEAQGGQGAMLKSALDRLAVLRAGQQVPFMPAMAADTGQMPGSPAPPPQASGLVPSQPSGPSPVLASFGLKQPPQPSPQLRGPMPAQMSGGPTPGAPGMQTAAALPPPQGAGQPPPTNQGIPPSSAAGRMPPQQPQQGGDPLRQYLQQMLALQRQRQQLAMAGGLLGAPSLGIGLGRAFTNAAETMPGAQGNMMNQIMGAQAAGEMVRQQPGMNDKDIAAARMQALFGGGGDALYKATHPTFHTYKYGNGIEGNAQETPGGREIDATTKMGTWAHRMGFRPVGGGPKDITYDPSQAENRTINGKTYYMMSDGKPRDPFAESADQ